MQALAMSAFVRDRTKLRPLDSKANHADLQFLKELMEAGKVTPVVDRTYSLSETADAMRHLEERQGRGKVVITV
jgi:NADPH:quinone reductase-like Zn-dependent oxidoreductase